MINYDDRLFIYFGFAEIIELQMFKKKGSPSSTYIKLNITVLEEMWVKWWILVMKQSLSMYYCTSFSEVLYIIIH